MKLKSGIELPDDKPVLKAQVTFSGLDSLPPGSAFVGVSHEPHQPQQLKAPPVPEKAPWMAAQLERDVAAGGSDPLLSVPQSLRESEDFLVAVHEAAHAVIAHHLGYAVEGLAVGLEGDVKGYVVHGGTGLTELGIREDELVSPVIWPHIIDEVHNQLLILFAGAMAVGKVTGIPYREVKGGEGDNEAAIHLIEEVEALRRRPGFEFLTDSYRGFLYPGSLLECAGLIGREEILTAILSVAGALVAGGDLSGQAFGALMKGSGIAKGRRSSERGRDRRVTEPSGTSPRT